MCIRDSSRIKSDVCAKETAAVLAANGIHAHIYPWLSPVPTLSFATRYLKCDAGVCVTASHNPAKYNGYKVYGSDGCQITSEMAKEVSDAIAKTDVFEGVKRMSFEDGVKEGRISYIKDEVINAFLQEVLNQSVIPEPCKGLKVVYTPLNGSGRVCVTRILDMKLCIRDSSYTLPDTHPDTATRSSPMTIQMPVRLQSGWIQRRSMSMLRPALQMAVSSVVAPRSGFLPKNCMPAVRWECGS